MAPSFNFYTFCDDEALSTFHFFFFLTFSVGWEIPIIFLQIEIELF